ncbi:MAG: S-methyl-5'-thioadenosine phosphorylase [Heliobacteriaceae bacterium]|jgi:5'-methylthioadenosine phosphorylase|nr:S-methyl-5'-thioadenosine phosphorylase [Heliobacteriaceae bacterium]
MENKKLASIGVFGGSGFYKFLDNIEEVPVETPYGMPSDNLLIGTIGEHRVAFMPRHGRNHSILPHLINYRANVWAMKSVGVERVFSPCAAGSLQKEVKPGDFVICDQFVDWTDGRKSTFYEGPVVTHPSAADPYCPQLRGLAVETARELGINVHQEGTVVVINGPRFSTKAESKFFTNQGWQVINMSAFPEGYLVKELDMCPLNISLITDYDAGLAGNVAPVSHHEVIKVFNSNLSNLKDLLFKMIEKIPAGKNVCGCTNTKANSRL